MEKTEIQERSSGKEVHSSEGLGSGKAKGGSIRNRRETERHRRMGQTETSGCICLKDNSHYQLLECIMGVYGREGIHFMTG